LIAIKNSIRSQFHVDLNSVIRFEAGAGQLRENCIEKKNSSRGEMSMDHLCEIKFSVGEQSKIAIGENGMNEELEMK
jgi:hypothetical protein